MVSVIVILFHLLCAVTGLLDQRGVGLNPDDQGGELDPHGRSISLLKSATLKLFVTGADNVGLIICASGHFMA